MNKKVNEVMVNFMNNLKNDSFKRQSLPNQPPYYDATKNDEILANYEKFLNSDLGKSLLNL